MLEFRPHHFLCTVGFEGKGYSEPFVQGFQKIANDLRSTDTGDEVLIRVTEATDSICTPCPNREGALCATEEKIQRLDQKHTSVLGLKAGQVLKWREAKQLIIERMTDQAFDQSCAPCSWKPLGMCLSALRKLRAAQNLCLAAMLVFSLPFEADARTPKSKRKPATLTLEEVHSPFKFRPLDQVRAEISKKHKSKQARALKKAWDALQIKNFASAIKLSSTLTRDPLFQDYADWIAGAAHLGAGQKALEAKGYHTAITAGEKAVALALQIEARDPYSPFLKNVPRDIGLAEILQGDGYAGLKKWKPAHSTFERGFQRLSVHGSLGLVRPETLQRYAQTCTKASTELCEAWIQRFSYYYPRNSEEMRALLKNYPELSTRTRPASAPKYTQSYKAPDLDQTAFDTNLGLYLNGKFGTSIKAFEQFVDEFPKSTYRFRARYWLGQALTHEQEHEKAQRAYDILQKDAPLTFYGLMAGLANGRQIDATITSGTSLAAERDPWLQPQEILRVRRAESFLSEGALDLALMELREFRSRDSLSSPFLMYLAALNFEARSYSTAFGILSDLVSRGYDGAASSAFLSMVFPIAYWDLIKKYGEKNNLDPILILSLMKQESAFDHGIISSAGATGLMQLMPATAADTEPTVSRADLIDPETNIRIGVKYLKMLMTRFNGNIVLSLAGYNAGPNAADRWLNNMPRGRGILEFIETIPYKETREYVASIIRNYYWYSHRLTPREPIRNIAQFWAPSVPPTPTDATTSNPEPSPPAPESTP